MRKPIHAAPMRIQRMMLKLQPYEFELVYTSGKSIGLADCLSRLPLSDIPVPLMDDELMVCNADTVVYNNHDEIERATDNNEDLQ